jgi:molybdate transport system substrate-binding protein
VLPSRRAAVAALVLACAVTGCGSGSGSGKPKPKGSLTVFASSMLQGPLQKIATRFEAANPGVRVRLRFGASRALYELTKPGRAAGVPGADVFATSDPSVIHDLSGNGAAADLESIGNPTNATIFISDALQIVTPPRNPKRIATLADLAKPSVTVALAGAHTVVGAVARQALARSAVSVARPQQTADAAGVLGAVASGRADAGIVYATDAAAVGATKLVRVPIDATHNLLTDYEVAQTTDTHRRALGEAFIRFLFGSDAQNALKDDGFQPIQCKGPVTNCMPTFSDG